MSGVMKTSRSRSKKASNSSSNAPSVSSKDGGAMPNRVATKKRNLNRLKQRATFSEGHIIIDLPLRTVSEANCFEPWRKKHKRHTEQKKLVYLSMLPFRDKIKLPCRVLLTRFAPNSLDEFDNLPVSFKYILDAVCAIITGNYTPGRADSDKRIFVACHQIKSKEYGIRIEITY